MLKVRYDFSQSPWTVGEFLYFVLYPQVLCHRSGMGAVEFELSWDDSAWPEDGVVPLWWSRFDGGLNGESARLASLLGLYPGHDGRWSRVDPGSDTDALVVEYKTLFNEMQDYYLDTGFAPRFEVPAHRREETSDYLSAHGTVVVHLRNLPFHFERNANQNLMERVIRDYGGPVVVLGTESEKTPAIAALPNVSYACDYSTEYLFQAMLILEADKYVGTCSGIDVVPYFSAVSYRTYRVAPVHERIAPNGLPWSTGNQQMSRDIETYDDMMEFLTTP